MTMTMTTTTTHPPTQDSEFSFDDLEDLDALEAALQRAESHLVEKEMMAFDIEGERVTLPGNTLAVLKSYFGFSKLRPFQAKVIAAVLAARDCLVLMPTGSGKSLCYQLPALLGKYAVVVVR